MADATTTPQTTIDIATEEQNRSAIARVLAERSERFNAQQPAVVAAPEVRTPLAAALSKLSAPAPLAPPRDLNATQAQLLPLLRKARDLMKKYDDLRVEIGERAADYSMLDMQRITKILPPTNDGENWARLNALVNAAREITGTFAAQNYFEMSRLIPIVQQFASGEITEYQDSQDRSRALYNPGVCIRYTEDQVKKFEVTVSALANNARTITLMEPLVAADLLLVQAAPIVPEPAPERMAVNQRLPTDLAKNYSTDFDPRQHDVAPPDRVHVTQVADGHHTISTRKVE
jgi:hypothetical protein